MVSSSRPVRRRRKATKSLHDLSDDLLQEILLRVCSPADLARASAACVSFRRLISDPVYLRRYRSIHPPLLLGFLTLAGFHPAEAPHPSAAVARAVARTGRFDFDFVPRQTVGRCWRPLDVCDGRVLVECRSVKKVSEEYRYSWELAVCDPLFRRYLLLPPVTDDLLSSVELRNKNFVFSGASFIPSGNREDTSFSVICWVHSQTKLVVFLFSSGSDHWSVGASTSWYNLGLYGGEILDSCQRVYGCCYWKVNCIGIKLLKLDVSTMELSTYDLPPARGGGDIVMVESGEGNVAMFYQVGAGTRTSVRYYNHLQNGTEKSYEWHMKSTVTLPDRLTSICFINGPAEGYIFLEGTLNGHDSAFFSLEIKSFKIERVASLTPHFAIPYFGFPPSMSSRRIQ